MADLSWFHEARYGMFIHWGPYSVAGRGEWVANRERIPRAEYTDKYARNFTADRYDPREWAKLARQAGMKYMVLTTRHHDGFCLWDTATTDFCAAKIGPKRDLVAPYVEACRAEGLKVGFYYSVADWFHPDYPDAYARDWPKTWKDEPSRKRFVAYYRSQLDELMTRYGPVDILWYDGCIPQPLDGRETNLRVKQLQPQILINERLGEPFDFRCSEQSLKEKEGPWEACLTLNDNWGYHAGDDNWKSPRQVIDMLLRTAGKGGNLLLNVGPRGDGTIPQPSVRILTEAGAWLARNREFLPNSSRSPFTWNNCVRFTTRGNTVFVHIVCSPGSELCIAEIANKVLSARLVDGGGAVKFRQDGPRLFLGPLPKADPIATSIALEVDGEPRPVQEQQTFWIPD